MIMDKIALTLLIIGGLNWGSVGLFRFDLVAFACGGSGSMISRVIYTLVGLAAIWCISLLFRLHLTSSKTAGSRQHHFQNPQTCILSAFQI